MPIYNGLPSPWPKAWARISVGSWMPVHFRPLCRDLLTIASPAQLEHELANWQTFLPMMAVDSTSFRQKWRQNELTFPPHK